MIKNSYQAQTCKNADLGDLGSQKILHILEAFDKNNK